MPDASGRTRMRQTRPADQVDGNWAAHQEFVSPEAQQPGLTAVQMHPEQETSNAFAMSTKSCQIFPDPLSTFDLDLVNGHGKTHILDMNKRAEVIPL